MMKGQAQIIDVSQNPYDLLPIVNALVDQIRSADLISGKPVIVLMGEEHELAASQLLQIALLKALKDIKMGAPYGLEYPDNTLTSMKDHFKVVADAQTAKGFWSNAQAKRAFDIRSLMMLMEHPKFHYRARFCLKENISVAFNDAAESERSEYMLDPHDADVSKALHDLEYQDVKNLSRKRPDMVHVRNLVIARNIVKNLETFAQKPQVYVQMLGAYHVLGQESDNIMERYPYHESVKELLLEMGYQVVSFSCLMEGIDPPENACFNRTVLAKGWDKAKMNRGFDHEVRRLVHHNRSLLFAHIGEVTEDEERLHVVNLHRQVHQEMRRYASTFC
jgi:hypothetical protein